MSCVGTVSIQVVFNPEIIAMPSPDFSSVIVHDEWLASPQGRVFVRRWRASASDPSLAPMLLLHDSLGCVELWRDFPARLCAATGREIIAYDRLGFGRSAARSGPLALDFIRNEALQFLPLLQQQLGLARFMVFGHSVGGGMAVNIAAESGRDCLALITVAAQAFVEPRILQGIRQAQELFRDPLQFARLQKYHGDKAEWVLNAWVDTWLSPAFAGWSLAPQLPRVVCPLLAVHGACDEYASERQPQMLAELCGGATQVALIAGAGHVLHRERPEGLAQLVAGFVNSV